MTNAEAWFNKSLRPRKPEGSLGRTAQDGHLDSHTAPELYAGVPKLVCLNRRALAGCAAAAVGAISGICAQPAGRLPSSVQARVSLSALGLIGVEPEYAPHPASQSETVSLPQLLAVETLS